MKRPILVALPAKSGDTNECFRPSKDTKVLLVNTGSEKPGVVDVLNHLQDQNAIIDYSFVHKILKKRTNLPKIRNEKRKDEKAYSKTGRYIHPFSVNRKDVKIPIVLKNPTPKVVLEPFGQQTSEPTQEVHQQILETGLSQDKAVQKCNKSIVNLFEKLQRLQIDQNKRKIQKTTESHKNIITLQIPQLSKVPIKRVNIKKELHKEKINITVGDPPKGPRTSLKVRQVSASILPVIDRKSRNIVKQKSLKTDVRKDVPYEPPIKMEPQEFLKVNLPELQSIKSYLKQKDLEKLEARLKALKRHHSCPSVIKTKDDCVVRLHSIQDSPPNPSSIKKTSSNPTTLDKKLLTTTSLDLLDDICDEEITAWQRN